MAEEQLIFARIVHKEDDVLRRFNYLEANCHRGKNVILQRVRKHVRVVGLEDLS